MKARSGAMGMTGLLLATLLAAGCQGAEESGDSQGPDVIEVEMSPLTLNDERTDPMPGGSPTQCTVGGITMHCCPESQAGHLHYVMIGVNLATNTFKCARLTESSTNRQAPFLNAANTSVRFDGQTFNAVCPSGAMVGLRWDQKRVACAAVSDFLPIVPYLDWRSPVNGFRTCLGTVNTGNASMMAGIATADPNAMKCLH